MVAPRGKPSTAACRRLSGCPGAWANSNSPWSGVRGAAARDPDGYPAPVSGRAAGDGSQYRRDRGPGEHRLVGTSHRRGRRPGAVRGVGLVVAYGAIALRCRPSVSFDAPRPAWLTLCLSLSFGSLADRPDQEPTHARGPAGSDHPLLFDSPVRLGKHPVHPKSRRSGQTKEDTPVRQRVRVKRATAAGLLTNH